MIKVNTGLAPTWYTPRSELDQDNPTRFKLKPLDGMQYVDFCSEAKFLPDGGLVPNRKGSEIALKASLSDWENFVDQNEKPIKFSPHNFKLLPPELISELVQEVVTSSTILEDDEKN